uniref:Uncharacterized protein n=1 Tax=Eutreptiella gymnastica TaxID=73025 RepID=A0A7S1NH49_9EUGL
MEGLALQGCHQISDAGLAGLVRDMGLRLVDLDVRGCDGVGDGTLRALAQCCPPLRSLLFGYTVRPPNWVQPATQVSDESLASVACACRGLQVLELDWHLHEGLTRVSLAPFLEVGDCLRGLMLWNLRNDTQVLDHIVEHFSQTVTQVSLINAYHRWSSFVLATPTTWGLVRRDQVSAFLARAMPRPIHGQLCPTPIQHSLALGLNVSREPDELAQHGLQAMLRHIPPGQVTTLAIGDVPIDEAEFALITDLAAAHGTSLHTVVLDEPQNFDALGLLVRVLQQCPNLTALRVCGRTSDICGYASEVGPSLPDVLRVLATRCPALRTLRWPCGPWRSLASPGLDEYDYLLRRCPCLETVCLPVLSDCVYAPRPRYKKHPQGPVVAAGPAPGGPEPFFCKGPGVETLYGNPCRALPDYDSDPKMWCHRVEHLILHSVYAPATPALIRTLPLCYPNLRTLDFGVQASRDGSVAKGPDLDSAALSAITTACCRLQPLRLPGCSLVDDASVEQVLRNCASLTALDISQCPLISQASILAVGHRYRTQLRQCVASFALPAVVLGVTRVCPNLRTLGGLPNLALEDWLQLVQDCPRLAELVEPVFPQGCEEWLIQTLLGAAPELELLGRVNVDYYRGLQYLL